MDTDRPIKVLFERQSQSLLPFIGETETGVSVTAVETVELPVPSRRIDSVLRLERDGFTWFRHQEFQSGPDPDMPRRCFEYNSRLIQDGRAGPLALVPLLRGGDEPDKVLAAVRMLDALPQPQSADGMSALLDFAGQRYDRATFWNVLGKDRVMQSWLWQMGRDEGEARGEARGRAEGEARGRAEGEAHALRRVCVDLAKEIHPRVAAHVLSAIESCDHPETLRDWILQCPRLSGAEFAALVTGEPPVHVTRSRTSRPSRRSRRRMAVRKRR